MTTKVKVGLIGAGKIGRGRVENLIYRISKTERVAVSDLFLETAENCIADYQIPTGYNDRRSILADNPIEAVLIDSNTDPHPNLFTNHQNLFPPFYCREQERSAASGNLIMKTYLN